MFYNQVYVPAMKDYIMKFTTNVRFDTIWYFQATSGILVTFDTFRPLLILPDHLPTNRFVLIYPRWKHHYCHHCQDCQRIHCLPTDVSHKNILSSFLLSNHPCFHLHQVDLCLILSFDLLLKSWRLSIRWWKWTTISLQRKGVSLNEYSKMNLTLLMVNCLWSNDSPQDLRTWLDPRFRTSSLNVDLLLFVLHQMILNRWWFKFNELHRNLILDTLLHGLKVSMISSFPPGHPSLAAAYLSFLA